MNAAGGSGTAGYRAARSTARSAAAFIDRSDRVRIEFTGAQAAATLNGLLTNDVTALKPGTGQYAAALTPKGKVVADVRVFARRASFLVDAPAAAGPGLLAMLRKYVNPRLAKYRDVSAETCAIGVFGPAAARVVAAATGTAESALAALAPFAHTSTGDAVAEIVVAHVPDLGVIGFDIIAPRAAADAVRSALVQAGAVELDAASAEQLRIETGRPLYGTDLDENVLAQEAGLDRLDAISFDKGCYTGQETVVRVKFRGHVNRTLRGLRAETPIATGAEVVGEDGAVAGVVRSAAESPTYGPIALAYVRREVADGTELTVRSAGGSIRATVVALPFA